MTASSTKPEIVVNATNEHFPLLRSAVRDLTSQGFHVTVYPVDGELTTENEEEILALYREFNIEIGYRITI